MSECTQCQELREELELAKKKIRTNDHIIELFHSRYDDIKDKHDKLQYFDSLKREYEAAIRELNSIKLKAAG